MLFAIFHPGDTYTADSDLLFRDLTMVNICAILDLLVVLVSLSTLYASLPR